jgi:hypothetical protein
MHFSERAISRNCHAGEPTTLRAAFTRRTLFAVFGGAGAGALDSRATVQANMVDCVRFVVSLPAMHGRSGALAYSAAQRHAPATRR